MVRDWHVQDLYSTCSCYTHRPKLRLLSWTPEQPEKLGEHSLSSSPCLALFPVPELPDSTVGGESSEGALFVETVLFVVVIQTLGRTSTVWCFQCFQRPCGAWQRSLKQLSATHRTGMENSFWVFTWCLRLSSLALLWHLMSIPGS